MFHQDANSQPDDLKVLDEREKAAKVKKREFDRKQKETYKKLLSKDIYVMTA